MATCPLAPKRTIVCIGDCLPTTPQPNAPGEHWTQVLDGLVMAACPDTRVAVVDSCAPGQRLHLLRERWDDDVLWYQPDTVVIMCGVSDAYHTVQRGPEYMEPDTWAAAMRTRIDRTRQALPDCNLVFLEPFLHTLSHIPAAELLPLFQTRLRALCAETGCTFVPLAERLQQRILTDGEFSLGTSLEPNLDTQLLIADAALGALVPDAPRTCPAVDDKLTLCIGDSITAVGRRQPQWAPLGHGYVRVAHDLWYARAGRAPRMRNEGIGGNTIVDLQQRWERDVLAHAPTRLTIKVGINDINRTLSGGSDAVSLEQYRTIYHGLLSRTRNALPQCRIGLIQPFYLSRMSDPLSYRTMVLEALGQYQQSVRELAEEFGCPVMETHEVLQRHLLRHHRRELAGEPVHPHLYGHTIIAEEFLRLMEKLV
jgi:acyl-CoA thioesterase I